MFKFFRKIRYNLMESGKTAQYFKYALGEIILVVLGILIALQINNWNENRKARIDEKELLTNLEIEFARKLNELYDKNNGRQKNIEQINGLQQLIVASNPTFQKTEMDEILGDLLTTFKVNEEFSIINMLFNSGKINTISNDSLKAKLISWPDKMEEMLEEQRELSDYQSNTIFPFLKTYISQLDINAQYEYLDMDTKDNLPSAYPSDYRGLFRDRQFENILASKKLYLKINRTDTAVLIKDAEAILDIIKQEISR